MTNIYPIYTIVSPNASTICKRINEEAFRYPFFNDGVSSCFKEEYEYDLSEIVLPSKDDCLPLIGLIFHTSHCGSTLLSRMLGQIQQVKVISEPEAINGLLLAKRLHNLEEKRVIKQLRHIIQLYCQKVPFKKSVIIKLTSWNVFELKLIQKAFPTVKWIYIDRNTEKLLQSLKKAEGGFIDWWNHPVDIVRKQFLTNVTTISNKETYLRNMIIGHRNQAINGANENSFFVEYPSFIEQYEKILEHFGMDITPKGVEASKEMLRYNSKSKEKQIWKKGK